MGCVQGIRGESNTPCKETPERPLQPQHGACPASTEEHALPPFPSCPCKRKPQLLQWRGCNGGGAETPLPATTLSKIQLPLHHTAKAGATGARKVGAAGVLSCQRGKLGRSQPGSPRALQASVGAGWRGALGRPASTHFHSAAISTQKQCRAAEQDKRGVGRDRQEEGGEERDMNERGDT